MYGNNFTIESFDSELWEAFEGHFGVFSSPGNYLKIRWILWLSKLAGRAEGRRPGGGKSPVPVAHSAILNPVGCMQDTG